MLDCANRVNLFEGRMTADMFSMANMQVFAVRYGQWPLSGITLEQVDEKLAPIRNATDPTKYLEFPVSICEMNAPEPSPKDIVDYIETNFDGIVIGGSHDSCMDDTLPYVQPLLQVIRLAVQKDIPTLGICFGAQAISRALHGDSAVDTMKNKGKEGEFGIIQVHLTESQNPIFKNIPSSFYTTISHGDCFIIPEEKDKLARTRNWDNQAYQIKNKRTFGLQFHPEFTAEDGANAVLRTIERDGKSSHIHRDATEPDMNVARQIAENFLNVVKN